MTVSLATDGAERRLAAAARAVSSAAVVADCHRIAAAVTEDLARAWAVPRPAALEIALAPPDRPVLVWRSDTLAPQASVRFGRWFRAARCRPGRLCDMDMAERGLIAAAGEDDQPLYAGFLIARMVPPPATVDALAGFCGAMAARLHRLRRERESRLRRARIGEALGRRDDLLAAAADLLWEAGSDGTIRVLRVLNGRTDLARYFQGRPLGNLHSLDGSDLLTLATQRRPMRMLRLRRQDDAPPGGPFHVTVSSTPGTCGPFPLRGMLLAADGGFGGCAAPAAVLKTVIETREHARDARGEAEAMLAGLRLLLCDLPQREKLERVARCVADTIGSVALRLVLIRPGEKPRLLGAGAGLTDAAAKALADILARETRQSVTVLPQDGGACGDACAVLDLDPGPLVLIALPHREERLYLFCRVRHEPALRRIARAERLTLLLQQALLLQDDQNRLAHAARLSALGRISASIAHELRQPLNAISITAQGIEVQCARGAPPPEDLRDKIARILGQVDRACQVMDRMRRFGRAGGGGRENVALGAIVHGARALMDHAAARQGVAVTIAVPDDLTVLANAMDIEQVLVNLIQNALDAIAEAPRPAAPGRIRLYAANDPGDADGVCLCVADNGPGFSPGVARRALDAFFTTKPPGKGTGLGLSIAHAILCEHGGRLAAGNGAQGGGLVTLFLRRAVRDASVQDR